MKAVKILRYFECWDCGDDSHAHIKEVTANNCIAKQEAALRPKSSRPDSLKRKLKITRSLLNGTSPKILADEYGVCSGRILQLAHQLIHQSRHPKMCNHDTPYTGGLREHRKHAKDVLWRLEILEAYMMARGVITGA